jgi:nucleoside-diphosphate-sugar epimerase
VREDDPPEPIEIYGKSKWEGEKILQSHKHHFDSVIIRCPTITDAGRLGLLTILFEFIEEGRRVWVVGKGDNRYQFVFAQDLAAACVNAATYPGSGVFNVGSDNVRTMREVYEEVIRRAGTGARVAQLPKLPTILAMRLAYLLGMSPLGPYHYKMIAESFIFDNNKAKRELGFVPTASNEEMLWRAYEYYRANAADLRNNPGASSHRRPAKMGVIKLLKWIS